jgi:hypothetical protein
MFDVVEAPAAGEERADARRDFAAAVACGVPEIVTEDPVSALALEDSPAGRPVTVHLNGAVPPVAVIVQV